VLVAERFGGWPWELEEVSLDKLLYYLNIMSAEGAAHELVDDLPEDETLVRD
jgi:hypothetical protein